MLLQGASSSFSSSHTRLQDIWTDLQSSSRLHREDGPAVKMRLWGSVALNRSFNTSRESLRLWQMTRHGASSKNKNTPQCKTLLLLHGGSRKGAPAPQRHKLCVTEQRINKDYKAPHTHWSPLPLWRVLLFSSFWREMIKQSRQFLLRNVSQQSVPTMFPETV